MKLNPQKKNIIVTGINGNLGLGVYKKFKKKYNIIGIDINKKAKNFDNFYKIDLTKEALIKNFFNYLSKKKIHISYVINCAGYFDNQPIISIKNGKFHSHSLNFFNKIFKANFVSAFLITVNYASYLMNLRKKGAIINFSSISSKGNSGQAAYGISKKSIEMLNIFFSNEALNKILRINVISPGFVDVASTKKILGKAKIDLIKKNTPSNNLVNKSNIYNTLEFIMKNKNVNGEVININDGYKIY